MPTYEFRCPSGHSFERFYRKIAGAATELECPVCGKVAARQLSGGAGLVFKGSGFYLTDYGRNAHRKEGGTGRPSEKSGGEPSSDAKSSESTGDSKAAESKSEASTSSGDSKRAESSGGASSEKPSTKADSSGTTPPKKPGSSD
jgi:putative FmdB family regulatory protein